MKPALLDMWSLTHKDSKGQNYTMLHFFFIRVTVIFLLILITPLLRLHDALLCFLNHFLKYWIISSTIVFSHNYNDYNFLKN